MWGPLFSVQTILVLCCLLIQPVGLAAAQGSTCPGPSGSLPVSFPTDVFLFVGVVEVPTIELKAPGAAGSAWAVQIRVDDPIHLPDNRDEYQIRARGTGIQGNATRGTATLAAGGANLDGRSGSTPSLCGEFWGRDRLVESFATGDVVKVVGYRDPDGGSHLVSPPDSVPLLLAGRSQKASRVRVENYYDYLEAMLRMEGLADDYEKVATLTAMARWIEDPAVFRALLQAQIKGKKLRREIMALHPSRSR